MQSIISCQKESLGMMQTALYSGHLDKKKLMDLIMEKNSKGLDVIQLAEEKKYFSSAFILKNFKHSEVSSW